MKKSCFVIALLMSASMAMGSSGDNLSVMNGMLGQARPQSVKIVNSLGRPVDVEAMLTRIETFNPLEKKRISSKGTFVFENDKNPASSFLIQNFAIVPKTLDLLEKIVLRVNAGESVEVSVNQWPSFVSELKHVGADGVYFDNTTKEGAFSVSVVATDPGLRVSAMGYTATIFEEQGAADVNFQAYKKSIFGVQRISSVYRSVIQKGAEILYGLSVTQLDSLNNELTKQSHELYGQKTDSSDDYKIPLITHRIWLTDEASPKEAPEDRLVNYITSLRLLSDKGWEHNFWCIDPVKIPKTIATLQSADLGIKIRKVDELKDLISGNLFKRLMDVNLLTFASDVFRKEILYRFGGLYSDVGILFNYDFTSHFKKFKFAMLLREWGELDVGIMASEVNSKILETDLKFLKELPSAPLQFKSITLPLDVSHCWLSGYHLISFVANQSLKTNTPVFFCIPELHMKIFSMASWKRKPLYDSIDIFSEGYLDCSTSAWENFDLVLSSKKFLPEVRIQIVCPPNFLSDQLWSQKVAKTAQKMGIDAEIETDYDSKEADDKKFYLTPAVHWACPYKKKSELHNYCYDQLGTNYYHNLHGLSTIPTSIQRFLKVGKTSFEKPVPFETYPAVQSFFSAPRTSFKPLEFKALFYCGSNWDNRQEGLTKKLDATERLLNLYGPKKAWEGYKSYKGFCEDINLAIQASGIALVIHSHLHNQRGEPTVRIFAAAAASALIISDRNPFVIENFADSVLYIDENDGAEENLQKILGYVKWARENSQQATAMAKKAHDIFTRRFTLEQEILKIIQVHQETLVWEGRPALPPRGDFSFEFQPSQADLANLVLRILAPKKVKSVNRSGRISSVSFFTKFLVTTEPNEKKLMKAPTGSGFTLEDPSNSPAVKMKHLSSLVLRSYSNSRKHLDIFCQRVVGLSKTEFLPLNFEQREILWGVDFSQFGTNLRIEYSKERGAIVCL